MLELKIVLCLVVRRFELRTAYEELDTKEMKTGKVRSIDEERAYQVGKGSRVRSYLVG